MDRLIMKFKYSCLMQDMHRRLTELGIEILDGREDLVRCPGKHLHTKPNGIRDCKLYGTPNNPVLKCLHSSCWGEVDRINKLLRGGKAPVTPPAPDGVAGTEANTATAEGSPKEHSPPVPQFDRQWIDAVIAEHPWNYEAIVNDCPNKVSQLDVSLHSQALLLLFAPDDVIWMGRDPYDSGKSGHSWRFRTAEEWKKYGGNLGILTCPSTFMPGSFSRSANNVKARRYLVVESDILSRDEVGSIFKWLTARGYRLRAVVDTAGKSLHGWFDFPGEDALRHLKPELVRLGCDPAMFGASQPCRLPGGVRDGKHQKLLYLDYENHQPTPANNETDKE